MALITSNKNPIQSYIVDRTYTESQLPGAYKIGAYVEKHYFLCSDTNETVARPLYTLILADLRHMLFTAFNTASPLLFKQFYLHAAEALAKLVLYKDPEPLLKIIITLKQKNPEFKSHLDRLSEVCQTAERPLYFAPLVKYINPLEDQLIVPVIAAGKSFCFVYAGICLLREAFDTLGSSAAGIFPEPKRVVNLTTSADLQYQITRFERNLGRNNLDLINLIPTLYKVVANVEKYYATYGKWLTVDHITNTTLTARTFTGHARDYLEFFSHVSEIFRWATGELEKSKKYFILLANFYHFMQEPDALEKLALLDKEHPQRFNEELSKMLLRFTPKNPEETAANIPIRGLIERVDNLLMSFLAAPLNNASQLKHYLVPAKPPKVKPAPKQLLSPDAKFQQVQQVLDKNWAALSSPEAYNVHFHLQQALLRLASFSLAPRTPHQLRAFVFGLIFNMQLAIEQSLTAIMHRDNPKDGVLTHDFYYLLYNLPVDCPLDEKTRTTVYDYNGGELLLRFPHLSNPKGNAAEQLIAHTILEGYDPNTLLDEALKYAQTAFDLCMTLSSSFKVCPPPNNLFALFASSLDLFRTSFSGASWEKNAPYSMSALSQALLDIKVKKRDEDLGENLKGLVENFFVRLEVLKARSDHTVMTLGEAELVTQMAAEELFMILLLLQGKNINMKEIDHDLFQMTALLDLGIKWDKDETAFLNKGKQVRRSTRYPNSSTQIATPVDQQKVLGEIAVFETICLKVLKAWEKQRK